MIRINGLTISVVDDKTGATTMSFGIWDQRCNVLLEADDLQRNTNIQNVLAYQDYNRKLANYQGAVDAGRLETTVPALVLPVKPLKQFVSDPFFDENEVLKPAVLTSGPWVPALRDVVYPKITPTQVNT
jgi:hypothetical protein